MFDDSDPEEASYIGRASIPLMPLRDLGKDPSLKGTFPLVHRTAEGGDDLPDREQNLGTIDIEIYWQHPYVKSSKPKYVPLEVS